MTPQTTFNPSLSNLTPPSPRSNLPNSNYLNVTNTITNKDLQGSEKSSASAMQTLQQKQTQPIALPTLSPSRVTTSVADDLDALLDDTLEEFSMSLNPSSSSTIQSPAISNLSSACVEEIFDIEPILAQVVCMGFPNPYISLMESMLVDEITLQAQQVNKAIERLNLCFKSLLKHSDNPGPWLEQESKTPFYLNCRPFAASYSLLTSLDKATSIQPYLNQTLIADWKDNYEQCVILLKKYGLDQYNETEFKFSWKAQLAINVNKMMSENQAQNPHLNEEQSEIKNLFQNPQHVNEIKKLVKSFMENPQGMLAEMFNNPQFSGMMGGAQMGALGMGGPAATEMITVSQIQQLISFFQKLESMLNLYFEDALAVEAWLEIEAAKPTYLHPFFSSKELLTSQLITDSDNVLSYTIPELKSLYESCCKRLTTLGLQKYVDEALPKEAMDMIRQVAVSQKEYLQVILDKSLSVLRPLSEKLKELDPEECTFNAQVIEQWIKECKTTGSYFPPFGVGEYLCQFKSAFEEALDGELFEEFNRLLPICKKQLLALGLNTYVEEMPIMRSTEKPDIITSSASEKSLLDTERCSREIEFFRAMILQKDEDLDQWLAENSSKYDYPLLWAKKWCSQRSHLINNVDKELYLNWITCADACLEKVNNSAHVNLEQIPADASPELKTFLS